MHHIDLDSIHLDAGSHSEDGRGCVMEWAARFAGLPVTDHPACTSPVLTAFAISWNDALPDATRQRLIPFIPRLVGTAGDPKADEVRAWMATDWLVRTFTVAWLRKAGLTARADDLAALPALSSIKLAKAAQPIIEAAGKEAAAARDATGDAAWVAVGDAAWAATGVAARAAHEKTKGTASAKYGAAYRAARPILDKAFAETTAELTESAFDLFDRMIDVRSAAHA